MRLFISYARVDKTIVQDWLVNKLEAGGHEVWFNGRLAAGQDWEQQLSDEIRLSSALVYCMSPETITSEWCQWELVRAVSLGKPVVLVLLHARTQLPEKLKALQYVDFSDGSTADTVARLIGGLQYLAPEQVPAAPEKPQGNPPQAIEQEANTELTRIMRVLRDPVWQFVGVVIAVVSIVFGIFTSNEPGRDTQSDPQPLPAGFNVVVAGFGYLSQSGDMERNTQADNLSDYIAAEVRQITQVDNTLGWRSNGVGRILGRSPSEREAQAAEIAQNLNADVVVYGFIVSDGRNNVFQPEFYVGAEFAALEPELVGADTLGAPLRFISNSDDDEYLTAITVQQRLSVLRFFLKGLTFYLKDDFTNAIEAFEDALEVETNGLEVVNIFAGNAAIRIPDSKQALEFYNESLQRRPEYSRALIGRGIVFYRLAFDIAGDNPPPYNPNLRLDPTQTCADIETSPPEVPQLLAILSLRCYREAALSPDQPETADIDVKVAFGLGQTSLWLSLYNYGNYWDDVETELSRVIELYESSTEARQSRIRASAGHAHAWLGLRLLSLDGNNPDSLCIAHSYYSQAVSLLKVDGLDYHHPWTELYGEQIAAIDRELDYHGIDCKE